MSDVPSGYAQKYQHVPGFVTDDIPSGPLVFLECHVTGVTKGRINTMFRTNSKPDYLSPVTDLYPASATVCINQVLRFLSKITMYGSDISLAKT